MDDDYLVRLPTARTGFLPDLEFRSGSADWGAVAGGEEGPRQGRLIRVPDIVFEPSRRVEDETSYEIAEDGTLVVADGPPRAGCVALVLESPHRQEFDGQGGVALDPLRDPNVRRALVQHLPRLIAAAGTRLGESLSGRTVALVNAVQYQTSLQAIMRDYGGRLRRGVRTPVWKAIFRQGGADELERRLERHQPHLVLLAPTGAVRPDVRSLVSRRPRSWSWCEIDHHPSYWGRSAPSLRGNLHRAAVEVPEERGDRAGARPTRGGEER